MVPTSHRLESTDIFFVKLLRYDEGFGSDNELLGVMGSRVSVFW